MFELLTWELWTRKRSTRRQAGARPWIEALEGRYAPAVTITEFSAGITASSSPQGITAGPDGNLWFTEAAGRIGRVTPQGAITEFSTGISPNSNVDGITVGPDGNLWFTEVGGRIGK